MGKLWGNTPSYKVHKWIKTVSKLGYWQIHETMWRNAAILPIK